MKTPIYDFARAYAEGQALRAHMPGHKGVCRLGVEGLDITEIVGADSLYEASGIIAKSEACASSIFAANTLYSTEGTSLSIRAVAAMLARYADASAKNKKILAARNAHKTFIYGAALADVEVEWLYGETYLSCSVDADKLALRIREEKPVAVYITSPDYLGRVADVRAIADVCHRAGCLLIVDNAHGAYFKFLEPSCHPIDLGADVVCDSAHKTLPVLTGGAYLHISKSTPCELLAYARSSMELFGSTSPSYLILESLDLCNRELASGYAARIADFSAMMAEMRSKLNTGGYVILSEEPLKITIDAKKYGYLGTELASILEERGIYVEFSDPDYLVLMLSPDSGEDALVSVCEALLSIQRREELIAPPPKPAMLEAVMSPREALFSATECIPVSNSVGRILATASVGCPPAVPIAISGERIDECAREAFIYYGIENITVVKE